MSVYVSYIIHTYKRYQTVSPLRYVGSICMVGDGPRPEKRFCLVGEIVIGTIIGNCLHVTFVDLIVDFVFFLYMILIAYCTSSSLLLNESESESSSLVS